MEQAIILETTFLIDFERERHTEPGPATAFLREHPDHRLFITHTVAGELAAGTSLGKRERWNAFIRPFRMLPWTRDVDWEYGKAYLFLKSNGLLIGANDLWIAATALAHDIPVATANMEHYRRVPGIRLAAYRY